jgi:transcriptional regulator with XRE-family HTH domain
MIGQRIRARREHLELSQSQLGQRLSDLMGRSWPRQAVSAAERGERSFTAAELVAFAFSLGTSVSGLMTPQADVEGVDLGGVVLPNNVVVASVLPRLAGESRTKSLHEMQETLRALGAQYLEASKSLGPLGDGIQLLYSQLVEAMKVTSQEGQAEIERGTDAG